MGSKPAVRSTLARGAVHALRTAEMGRQKRVERQPQTSSSFTEETWGGGREAAGELGRQKRQDASARTDWQAMDVPASFAGPLSPLL